MAVSVTQFYQERFYTDLFAILSHWKGVLLRFEYLLLYKKWIPSLIFFCIVHIAYWIPIYLQLNKTFVLATLVCLAVLFDLGKNWLLPKIENFIKFSTGFNFEHEIRLAIKNEEIYSIQELSYYVAKGLRRFLKLMNVFAPYRENHPTVFLILSCLISLVVIWIGYYAKEHHLTYFILNTILIFPGLIHHRVFPKIWAMVKPYIDKLEAEFDKGQLESIAEREAGEKELWEPIASSPFFKKPPESDPFETPKKQIDSFDPDDLDTSEAQFIQSFIPHRMQMSTEKNKLALDTMTREIMGTCRNQDDIDYWFAEVTEDPGNAKRSHSNSGTDHHTTPSDQVVSPNANSADPTFNSDLDSAAWDDFSTDDEMVIDGPNEEQTRNRS
ncbi:unnamed protein product [Hymenolepis diminuta]|uniref:RETREG1-3/ARL6IP-like N-terminal reticulon-homology domain-containing protein n=1 Tax=Hymenolepis diminuta TaxID=6216 RepID=A0A564YXH1_HYMDI|nr:unnamed protein product [Hymenolepis diminuta]